MVVLIAVSLWLRELKVHDSPEVFSPDIKLSHETAKFGLHLVR